MDFRVSRLGLTLCCLLATTTHAAIWPPGYSQAVLENLFARQYSPVPPPLPNPISPCDGACGSFPVPPPPQPIAAAPPVPIAYYLVPYPAPVPNYAYEPLPPPAPVAPLPPPPVSIAPPPIAYGPPPAVPLPPYLAPHRFFFAAPYPAPQPIFRPPPIPIPAPIAASPLPPPPPAPFSFIPGISLKLFAPLLRQPIPPPPQPLFDPCTCLNDPGPNPCPCQPNFGPNLPPPPIPQAIQAGPPCGCSPAQINCNCLPPPQLNQPLNPNFGGPPPPEFAPPPLQSKYYAQFGARKSRDSFKEDKIVEDQAVETKQQ